MADAPPPIRVVCSDLSDNCLGRAVVLAEVLQAFGPVRIVGPQRGATIWRPALSSSIPIEGVALRSGRDYGRVVRFLRRQLGGARVVVSKPRATSLGLTLASGVRASEMLLDIDDWELGMMQPAPDTSAWRRSQFYLLSAGELLLPGVLNSYWSTRALDAFGARVPRRLVSNGWLQRRFGGVLVPHVRDTEHLEPTRFAEAAASRRRQHGMEGRSWVGFIGTVRAHKGVEDLLEAVAALPGEQAPGLLLAGLNQEDAYARKLLQQARAKLPAERLIAIGPFDAAELPAWVAATDVLCVPSRDVPGAWGQIPAKLFDAMAMARPIVASDVNDMGAILDGCGLVYRAGNVRALGECLGRLRSDAELAAQLGQAARARAVASYSVASARLAVAELVKSLPVVGSELE